MPVIIASHCLYMTIFYQEPSIFANITTPSIRYHGSRSRSRYYETLKQSIFKRYQKKENNKDFNTPETKIRNGIPRSRTILSTLLPFGFYINRHLNIRRGFSRSLIFTRFPPSLQHYAEDLCLADKAATLQNQDSIKLRRHKIRNYENLDEAKSG